MDNEKQLEKEFWIGVFMAKFTVLGKGNADESIVEADKALAAFNNNFGPVQLKKVEPGPIMPRRVWEDRRIGSIHSAIKFNERQNLPIPASWVEELEELKERIKKYSD